MRLSPVRQVAPDITVVRHADAGGRRLAGVPVLVVEVQSPSTRAVDLTLKRQALQDAGFPSYWLVEPDELVLTVLELVDGHYEQVAVIKADERWTTRQPFPVDVTLA